MPEIITRSPTATFLGQGSSQSIRGNKEITLPKLTPKETLAQKFYKMSKCNSKAELARKVEDHPVMVRVYLLEKKTKSWRAVPLHRLHLWASMLAKNGGPPISMGLWSDGEITLEYEGE